MNEATIDEMFKNAVDTIRTSTEMKSWKGQDTFDIVFTAYDRLKENKELPEDFHFENCDKFVTDDGYTFYLFKDFYGFKKLKEDISLSKPVDDMEAQRVYLNEFKQFIFEYHNGETGRGRAFPWVGLPTKYLHMYYKSDQKESIENDE